MTWLTWRQFRTQAITVYAGIILLALALNATSRLVYSSNADPATALGDVTNAQAVVYFVGSGLVALLPPIIGAFWGAPLVARELEAGTHLLVWNQSVTRARWLVVKLLFIGATAFAAAALLGLAVTWWAAPIDRLAELVGDSGLPTRITPWLFDSRGIASAGHAVFAFVLGVTMGVLVRRTVPAMAITLAIFVAVQIAVPMWVRPHLFPPTDQTVAVGQVTQAESTSGEIFALQSATPSGAWVHVNETLDPSGRVVEFLPAGTGGCTPPELPPEGSMPGEPQSVPDTPAGPTPKDGMQTCLSSLADLGYRQHLVYHAPDRFWALQWAETALYLVMSVGLAGLCLRWTRHRLS
jgi:hypothetical protein